ncbi:hypothetical protein D3C76_1468790 [compost metagenome]|jgi:hypothetical protein
MQERVHLDAVASTPCAPTAKMFTVVGKHPVMAFTDSRIRTPDDLFTGVFARLLNYPDRPAIGETFDIRQLDGTGFD